MKTILKFLNLMLTFCIIMVMSGCEKDDNPPAIIPPTSNCIITGETTTEGDYGYTSWQYEYSPDGNPLKITKFYPNGTPERTIEIYYDGIVKRGSVNGHDFKGVVVYSSDIFIKKLPSMAKVSETVDGITQVDFMQYFFFYDGKDRLNKVGQQTVRPGDKEYDLNIYYDDNDNVTGLRYEWTTGPREAIPPILVSAYDDKPNPYTSTRGIWKFIMNHYGAWNNSDPEPIITALSRNNALDLTTGPWTVKMSYTYNEHGFPIERVKNYTYENKEATTRQTFTYLCQ